MYFVCPDGEPQYREAVERHADRYLRSAGHEFAFHDTRPADDDEFAARIEGADGALVFFSVPPEVLRTAEQLEVVSWCGTGVARFVDLEIAGERGIAVCNVPDYGANAVAEHTIALALAVARGVARNDRQMRAGGWEQQEGIELAGRTLGVIGAGPIAARVAAIGRGLGMRVLAWTRNPSAARAAALGVEFTELDELVSRADVVTVNVAHTPETEGLVSRTLLERLRPDAILVNTARAEIVDTQALIDVVEQGRIFGAGIDVFDAEPPGAELVQRLSHERIVLAPHVGYYTGPANEELLRVAVANLQAFAEGAPENVVGGHGAEIAGA